MCNAAATVVVQASGITKYFGEVSALRDVGVTAHEGEVHGLLGANGAGKTTFLRILLGLVIRDAGHIRVLDRDLPLRPSRLSRGVAAVLEGAGFYPYLTGRRNLILAAQMDDISMTDAAVDEAIARVGLARTADRKVAGYSAGMRQRLAFAAALLRAPRLLLLDEPSSALDPAGAREVRALIRALADAGTTVLLSSHNLVEVETLCSSATVLRDGTVVFSGDVDRLRALAGPEMHAIETSDDAAAIAIAEHHAAVRVDPAGVDRDAGFLIAGAPDAIDRYVVALGQAGIAVRRLRPRERSLETVFLHLTGPGAAS